ncbi:MAG: acetate/propionate family kinase [Candidatus Rokuibacteriota bacterium]
MAKARAECARDASAVGDVSGKGACGKMDSSRRAMTVLVLNAGSSSLKFRLSRFKNAGSRVEEIGRGVIERIGRAGGEAVEVCDHGGAVRRVVERVAGIPNSQPIEAVGHRVVHGGSRFVEPTLIDDDVMVAIAALEDLAPLHNGPSLAVIRACREALGAAVPMIAVFDTAFHATLPEHASRYAIPYEMAERHGIRRFGFHGTSYRSVVARYGEVAGRPVGGSALVVFHLGNGCSVAAIRDGVSVDTSMGFTPLEGLVMGTRAGDLDPALVGYLARKEGVPTVEVEGWLNERSGLLGLSGHSADMRDLLTREQHDRRARLAVDVFCYRARKYLGAYLAALGGAHAVVFTGGIGEHQPEVRARICAGMEWCGLTLDERRNAEVVGAEGCISAGTSAIRAFVIPTDEEAIIARDTMETLRGQ